MGGPIAARPRPERLAWLPPAALVVLALAPFLPALGSGKVFVERDHLQHFLPKRQLLSAALRGDGSLTWNPYQAAGSPFLADPQSGVLYPPALLLFGAAPFPFAYAAYPALHVVLAGLGTWWWLRARGRSRWAAAIGGLVVQSSGFTLSLLDVTNNLCSLAWAPVALGAAERLRRRGGPGWAAATAGALAAALLAGEPQLAAVTALLVAALLLRGRRSDDLPTRARRLALVAAVAVGLSAIQLLPMLAFLGHTRRADGVPIAMQERGALRPADALDILAPRPFQRGERTWSGSQDYLSTLYLGWAPLVAAAALRRADLRRNAAWLALVPLGFLLGMGPHLPSWRWLHEYAGFDALRYPVRFFALALFGVAVLAARGADRLFATAGRRDGSRWGRPSLLVVPAVAAALATSFRFAPAAWPEDVRQRLTAGLVRGLLIALAVVGAVALARRLPRRRRLLAPALAALVALDLLAWPHAGFATAEWRALLAPPEATRSLRFGDLGEPPRVHNRLSDEARAAIAGAGEPSPRERARRIVEMVSPATSLLHGVAETSRDGVYPLRSHEPLLAALDAGGVEAARLLGVQLFVAPSLADGGGPFELRRVAASAPSPLRLFEAAPGGESLDVVLAALRPGADGLAAGLPVPTVRSTPPGHGACAARGRVELLAWRAHRLDARVELPCSALLVHTTTWLPGWRAEVDGRRVELLPGLGGAVQATWVPSGTHRVRLSYRTPGLIPGAIVSSLGLLAVATLAARTKRRRHRAPTP